LLISLLLPFKALAEDMKIFTLEQVLQIASEKNRDIQKAMEYSRWVHGKYVEERAAAFPQFSMNGSGAAQQDKTMLLSTGSSQDTLKSVSAEIGLTQTLFSWGKVGAAIRAAKEGLKTAEEQLRLYRQAAFRDVSVSFFDILLARQIHSIALQDLSQKERHLEEARRKFTAGVATDYEVLAAEVAVENARPEVIRSENQIRTSLDRLRFLLAIEGADIDVTGSLETSILPVPVYQEIYSLAIKHRPEMKDLRLRSAIAGELVNIAAAEDKPRLEFKGGYGWKELDMGDMNLSGRAWNAGLYFSFPFFDGMRTRGKIMQAVSDRQSLKIDESKLADSIALQARDALNSVNESEKIVKALSGTVTQAEKLLFLSEKGYEFGVKIRLEVDDAELKLQMAKANLSRAWRDYRAARVNLLWVMGVLGENN
jgi:HAE1 family hydrophobic/amphiphilic exporter-1